jgi:two-component system chemotaxis sensor kinase CheA
MTPLLELFISESRELLESASKALLALERDPSDAENLNRVFRATHTLKSSAAMFDFDPMRELMHAAEDLLDRLRGGEFELDAKMTDRLLDALDMAGQWVDHVEGHENLPDGAADAAHDLVDYLRPRHGAASVRKTPVAAPGPAKAKPETSVRNALVALPGQQPGESKQSVSDQTPQGKTFVMETLAFLRNDQRRELFRNVAATGQPFVLLRYTPEPRCFFANNDPFEFMRRLPGLLLLHVETPKSWPLLGELDPYDCRLSFVAVSSEALEAVRNYLQGVIQQVLVESCDALKLVYVGEDHGPVQGDAALAEALAAALRDGGTQALMEEAVRQLSAPTRLPWQALMLSWLLVVAKSPLATPEVLQALIASLATGTPPVWHAEPARAEMSAEAVSSRLADDVQTPSATPVGPSPEAQQAFREVIQVQMALLDLSSEPSLWRGIQRSATQTACNALAAMERVVETPGLHAALEQAIAQHSSKPLHEALQRLITNEGAGMGAAAPVAAHIPIPAAPTAPTVELTHPVEDRAPVQAKTLKVDQARIDNLMELIGELIVAKNGLQYLSQQAERVHGNRTLSKEIKEHHGAIEHIAEAMQRAIMHVRMLPLSQVMQRLPRVVRDISHELGKQVELVMEGEETEADKNVIEHLLEPLVHLVRNSIDHGLEPPEMRRKVGKPAVGRLGIRAWQEGENLFLEVRDDGRGIDAERVRERMRKMELLEPERIAALSDDEVIQYCFAAGLSTADKVSAVSGRGVGMDVVQSTLDRLGGRVVLQSRPGEGTATILVMPLSAAVTRVMTFEVQGRQFGLPIDSVVETQRIDTHQVQYLKQSATFPWRGRTLPLLFLSDLLELETSLDGIAAKRNDIAVLVVKHAAERVGLVVDRFLGGMELIVRPLDGVLAKLDAYSGTALLGDGSVLLVLNLRGLL